MSCRVEIMFVKSDFSLRPMELRDKDSIRFWRNQPHVRDVMYTDHIITHEEHDTWFERAIQSPDAVYLILEHRDASVAFINFTSIDRKNNKCFWGFYLTYPPPAGKGSFMAWFSLEWCFSVMGIRKLCSESFAFNTKACSIYRKFGFTQEARYRKHILKKGSYEDVLGFGLLADEWFATRQNMAQSVFK